MRSTNVLMLVVAGTLAHGQLVTVQGRGARPPPSWCSESGHSCPWTEPSQTPTIVTLPPPVSIAEPTEQTPSSTLEVAEPSFTSSVPSGPVDPSITRIAEPSSSSLVTYGPAGPSITQSPDLSSISSLFDASTMTTSVSSGPADPSTTGNTSAIAGASGDSKGSSPAMLAGIGAGVSIGVLVIAGVAFFIIRKRRKTQANAKEEFDAATLPPDGPVDEKKSQLYAHRLEASELDGGGERAEMWSPPAVTELETTSHVLELPGDSNFLHTTPKPDARMSTVSELEDNVGK